MKLLIAKGFRLPTGQVYIEGDEVEVTWQEAAWLLANRGDEVEPVDADGEAIRASVRSGEVKAPKDSIMGNASGG